MALLSTESGPSAFLREDGSCKLSTAIAQTNIDLHSHRCGGTYYINRCGFTYGEGLPMAV